MRSRLSLFSSLGCMQPGSCSHEATLTEESEKWLRTWNLRRNGRHGDDPYQQEGQSEMHVSSPPSCYCAPQQPGKRHIFVGHLPSPAIKLRRPSTCVGHQSSPAIKQQ